jgi:hypothetical protein
MLAIDKIHKTARSCLAAWGNERLRTGHVGLAERTTFRLPLWLDRESLPKIGSIALWSNIASVWAFAFRWAIEQRKQPSLLKSYML